MRASDDQSSSPNPGSSISPYDSFVTRIAPFIATLATLSMVQGISYIIQSMSLT